MRVTTLRTGFVAEIMGLDPAQPASLDALWPVSGAPAVLVFRNQKLTYAQQVRFTGNFGQPERYVLSFWNNVDPGPERPEMVDVSNLDAATGEPVTGASRHRGFNLAALFAHAGFDAKLNRETEPGVSHAPFDRVAGLDGRAASRLCRR